jgi:hypothetical protein
MLMKRNQISGPSAKSALGDSNIPAWSLNAMARLLRTGDPAATIDRLFTSRHVRDLQLIIAVAFIILLLIFIVGFCFSLENQVLSEWPSIASRKSDWVLIRVALASVVSFLAFFSPVFVIFGAIVAWAYQVGSARLGVVDLFACEISTLCRVAAVADTVRRRVEKFNEGPGAKTSGSVSSSSPIFRSEENYFPVFEGNTRDLQTLEARVVINITAFYTYMKVVRDSMRMLAEIKQQPAGAIPGSEDMPATDPWHEAARNVIYMFFLAFESARRAVADLVEFEPERAERTIVILLSELEAYQFLSVQFPDKEEVHHERLVLRKAEYLELVPRVCQAVEAGRAFERHNETAMTAGGRLGTLEWEPAWRLLPELQRRYEATR